MTAHRFNRIENDFVERQSDRGHQFLFYHRGDFLVKKTHMRIAYELAATFRRAAKMDNKFF